VVLAAEALEEEALAANFSKVFKNQHNFVMMKMALFKKQAGKKPAVPEIQKSRVSECKTESFANLSFLKKGKVFNCPKDNTPMQKKTREGITIDKCEKCGGIWLDKGEMEKIIRKIEEHEKKFARENK